MRDGRGDMRNIRRGTKGGIRKQNSHGEKMKSLFFHNYICRDRQRSYGLISWLDWIWVEGKKFVHSYVEEFFPLPWNLSFILFFHLRNFISGGHKKVRRALEKMAFLNSRIKLSWSLGNQSKTSGSTFLVCSEWHH